MLVRVLEGQVANADTLAQLRVDGKLLARLQHECVLRVEQTSAVGGFLAIVHENFDCVSMEHVIAALRARGQVLPSRVAVEIAASVGIALGEVLTISDGERRLMHPSPVPAEVLVDAAGRVKLAGVQVLAGDVWPAPPTGYGAPEGAGGWQAATWMVGALLVELLTGEAPSESPADEARHEQMLRRLVLRLLARPGDTPGEPLVQAVRQALAHDVEVRGTPGAFGRMLRDLAVQLHTPGLRAWAPGTIPAVQRQAGGGRPSAPGAATLSPKPLPEPPLAPPAAQLLAYPGPADEPETTMVDAPLPALRGSPVSSGETRAVPVKVAPSVPPSGPSVTSRSTARPLGPTVGRTLAPAVTPVLLSLPISDDESEQTVVARPAKLDDSRPAKVDPLVLPLVPSSVSSGPARIARPAVSLPDEEPPPRNLVPYVLAGLTALFAAGSIVGVATVAWYLAAEPEVVDPSPLLTAEGVLAAPEPEPVVPAEVPAAVVAPSRPPAAAPNKPAVPAAAKVAEAPSPTAAGFAPEPTPPTSAAPVRIGAAPAPVAEAPSVAAVANPPPAASPPAPGAPPPSPVSSGPVVDPGPFRVVFQAADPGWTLEVKCMEGGGSGAAVTIPAAARGNCRVVGRKDAATVMTLVTVTASRDYSCFAGGTRSCR